MGLLRALVTRLQGWELLPVGQLQRKGPSSSAPSSPARLGAHAQTHRVAPLHFNPFTQVLKLYNQLVVNSTQTLHLRLCKTNVAICLHCECLCYTGICPTTQLPIGTSCLKLGWCYDGEQQHPVPALLHLRAGLAALASTAPSCMAYPCYRHDINT